MKKLVSICLVFLFAFGCATLPAYANETDPLEPVRQIYSSDDALELAYQIWPEHKDKLSREIASPTARIATAGSDTVVLQETYNLSENESVTYVEYASGFAAVFAVSNWIQERHTAGPIYDSYAGAFFVTNGPCTAHLLNFGYTINHNTYDRIDTFGTFSTVKANVQEHGQARYETASGNAYYTYMVYFVDDFGNLMGSSLVHLAVGNDNFTWSAS